jgi:hypothetical protein
LWVIIILSSQSSSLWSSLLIIPFSLLIVILLRNKNLFSGLFIFVYVIIFIGGLLVLLVRVASLTYQEIRFNFLKSWVFLCFLVRIPFLLNLKFYFWSNYFSPFIIWIKGQFSFSILLILVLTVGLLTISKMIISFKGIIRIY